jgi:hypothetical protein
MLFRVATPIAELVIQYRKTKRIPDAWIHRFSSRGDLEEAVQKAWAAEENPEWLSRIAREVGDRVAVARIACDIGRLFVAAYPEGDARPREAIALLDAWTANPLRPYPRRWRELYAALEPEEGKEDERSVAGDACRASFVMRWVLAVPSRPSSLVNLVEQAMNNLVQRRAFQYEDARGEPQGWTDAKIEEAEVEEGRTLAEIIRRHVPAPPPAEFREALAPRARKGAAGRGRTTR